MDALFSIVFFEYAKNIFIGIGLFGLCVLFWKWEMRQVEKNRKEKAERELRRARLLQLYHDKNKHIYWDAYNSRNDSFQIYVLKLANAAVVQ